MPEENNPNVVGKDGAEQPKMVELPEDQFNAFMQQAEEQQADLMFFVENVGGLVVDISEHGIQSIMSKLMPLMSGQMDKDENGNPTVLGLDLVRIANLVEKYSK